MCRPLNLNCQYEDQWGECTLPYGREKCPDLQDQYKITKEVLEKLGVELPSNKKKHKGRIITLNDIRKGEIK